MDFTTKFAPEDEVWIVRSRIDQKREKCPVCKGKGKYKPPGARGAPWACEECDATGSVTTDVVVVSYVDGPRYVEEVRVVSATASGADAKVQYTGDSIMAGPAWEEDCFATEAEAQAEAQRRNQ